MLVVRCALVVGSCSLDDPPGGDGRMSIATGGSGGVYQVYGGGVAEMFSANGHDTTAETTQRVGRQPLPRRRRRLRRRVLPRRHRDRRRQGPGRLRRRADAAAALGTLYSNFTHVVALKDSGITDRGPQGQDGLDRRAQLRHRGDRAAADGGRGARSRRGRDAARDGRGGVHRGAARGLDRRLRVVRRPAHGRDHRPRDHRRDRAAAARPLRAAAQRALRRGLPGVRGRGGRVPGRPADQDDRGPEPADGPRGHGRDARPRPDQADVRPQEPSWPRSTRRPRSSRSRTRRRSSSRRRAAPGRRALLPGGGRSEARCALVTSAVGALARRRGCGGADGPRAWSSRDGERRRGRRGRAARRRALRAHLPPLGLRGARRGALPRARRRPLRAREHRLAEPAGARVLRARRPRIARGRAVARCTGPPGALHRRWRWPRPSAGADARRRRRARPALRRHGVHLRLAVEGT